MADLTGAAAIGLDLSDPAAAPGAVEAAVDRLGGLDAVVSNAGITVDGGTF